MEEIDYKKNKFILAKNIRELNKINLENYFYFFKKIKEICLEQKKDNNKKYIDLFEVYFSGIIHNIGSLIFNCDKNSILNFRKERNNINKIISLDNNNDENKKFYLEDKRLVKFFYQEYVNSLYIFNKSIKYELDKLLKILFYKIFNLIKDYNKEDLITFFIF